MLPLSADGLVDKGLDWPTVDKEELNDEKHMCEQHKQHNLRKCIRIGCFLMCEVCGQTMSSRKNCKCCKLTYENGVNLVAREWAKEGKPDRLTMWKAFCAKTSKTLSPVSWESDLTEHVISLRVEFWMKKKTQEEESQASKARNRQLLDTGRDMKYARTHGGPSTTAAQVAGAIRKRVVRKQQQKIKDAAEIDSFGIEAKVQSKRQWNDTRA